MDLAETQHQKWYIIHGVQPNSAESLMVFTKFSELPTEIRLRIWNFMLPASGGVVHLRFEEPGRLYLTPSLPVTLRVNQESRNESIAQLTRIGGLSLGERAPKCYFLSVFDIVAVDKQSLGDISFAFFFWHVQNLLGQEGLAQMRTMAIEDVVWDALSRNSKPPNWEDWILKLNKFIIFHKETPCAVMKELKISEPATRDFALEAQIYEKFMQFLPTSFSGTSSSSESRMPEIRFLEGRAKQSLFLPALPLQTSLELDQLEDQMGGLSLG